MPLKAALKLLRGSDKMIQPHLLPGDTTAALGVHAVAAALLVT